MNILMFNSVFYPTKIGGAEQSVFNLAEGLVNLGHNVGVVSIVKDSAHSKDMKLFSGVDAYYLTSKNVFWPFDSSESVGILKKVFQKFIDVVNFRYYRDICRIIDIFKPDVVHTNNLKGISAVVWFICFLKKIKIIHTTRDYYIQCSKCSRRNGDVNCVKQCFPCKAYTYPWKLLSSKVDGVVGISNFIHDIHISEGYFRRSKSIVIYNGIEVNKEIKPKERLNSEMFYFGYLGRIEKDKGIYELLDNFAQISKKTNSRLLVAGGGDDQIIQKIKTAENVVYLGYVSQEELFKKIDFLIVPSIWFEPMGRVVIEAFSNGVPVIANSVGGITELLTEGVNGFLYEDSKHLSFIESVERAMSASYSSLSQQCLNSAIPYENKKIAVKYEEFIKKDILL